MLTERLASLNPDYIYDVFISYIRYRKRTVHERILVDNLPITENELVRFFVTEFLGKDMEDFVARINVEGTKKEASRLSLLQTAKEKFSGEKYKQNNGLPYVDILSFLLEYGIEMTLKSYFGIMTEGSTNDFLYAFAAHAANNLLRSSASSNITTKEDVSSLKYMVETMAKLQKQESDAPINIIDPTGGTIKRASAEHSNPRPPINSEIDVEEDNNGEQL